LHLAVVVNDTFAGVFFNFLASSGGFAAG